MDFGMRKMASTMTTSGEGEGRRERETVLFCSDYMYMMMQGEVSRY